MALQLDFWIDEETLRIQQVERNFTELKTSMRKIQGKLFAENGATKKDVFEIKERLAILERNICKGDFNG